MHRLWNLLAVTGASLAFALPVNADLRGDTLTVMGPWLSPDSGVIEEIFDIFEAETGVEVAYQGSGSFEQQIIIDVEAGAAPNIAIIPQPGLAAELARRGQLTPMRPQVADWVRENYAAGQSWVDLATYANPEGAMEHYGLFFRVDLKSLVWYSPENFEDAGYAVPQSMEALKALSDQMVADGVVPWCIGLGSGGATGWPGTDWVEDMMLRTQPPEIYDQWVRNELRFDAPQVIAAIEEFGSFFRPEGHASGGAQGVAATDFRDSAKGLFTAPAQCYMHRQASFIPSFFPDWVEIGRDVDAFYFPAYETKNLGKPVLGSGTLFTITRDSEAAHALIEFLQSPRAHEYWMQHGGFLTPHQGVDPEKFADAGLRNMNQILLDATTFRFDGSDLMPGAIGTGAFWTGMVDYASGASAQQVAGDIQLRWEQLK